MNKKGISLIIFAITIAILLILLGVTAVSIGSSIKNSRLSAFANDLTSLESAVEVYYNQTGDYPIYEENGRKIKYVKNSTGFNEQGNTSNAILVNNKNASYLTNFEAEITANGDDESSTYFYKVDLSKIDVKKSVRGTQDDGDTSDIYLIAVPSQRLYYAKGYIVDKKAYFSLQNVSNSVTIKQNETESTEEATIVKTDAGMKVSRENKEYTNKLGITIDANLESGEELYATVSGVSGDIRLSTTTGQNVIILKSLDGSLSLSAANITNFNNSEKYIIITKKKNGANLGSVKMDLSNLDLVAPTYPSAEKFVVTSSEKENTLTFTPSDTGSGISKVTYVPLTKYDESGNVVYINKNGSTDITEFDEAYMKTNAKSATISDSGEVTIKYDKDVEALYIATIDKAGNCNRATKNVTTMLYGGINLDSIDSDIGLSYAMRVKSGLSYTIASAKSYISTDGANWINEKNLTLTSASGIYKAANEYTKPAGSKIYVKLVITANDDTVTETRIKEFEVDDVELMLSNKAVPGVVYKEDKEFTDINGDKVTLPAGYYISESEDEQVVQNGLAAYDKASNKYIWNTTTSQFVKQ